MVDRYGHKKKSDHIGKRLSEFDFLSCDEEFEVKYIGGEIEGGPKGNKKKLHEYLEDRKGPEAEKIFRDIRRRCMLGISSPGNDIKEITDELTECGVVLTQKLLEELIERYDNYNNNAHLYCNRGWTPKDLSRKSIGNGPVSIKFGPGIEKAIAEGKLNREELEEQIRKMGAKIEK